MAAYAPADNETPAPYQILRRSASVASPGFSSMCASFMALFSLQKKIVRNPPRPVNSLNGESGKQGEP